MSLKRSRTRVGVWVILGLCPALWAQSDWRVLQPALSESLVRLEIPLAYEPSQQMLCQQNVEADSVVLENEPNGYRLKLDFPTPDGHTYRALVGYGEDLVLVGREQGLCRLRFLRDGNGPDESVEVLAEGYWISGSNMSLPTTVSGALLGLPEDLELEATLSLQLNQRDLDRCQGRLSLQCHGAIRGRLLTDDATVEVSVNWPYPNRAGSRRRRMSAESERPYVNVSVRPFDDKARYASGRAALGEVVNLGPAKVVAEKIATDYSRLVLAVLHGELSGQALQPKPVAVGQALDPFARVDLIRRHLVTLDELKRRVGPAGWIVMVFGDLPTRSREEMMRYGYGPRSTGPAATLPLSDSLIRQILQPENGSDLAVVLVTRRFPVRDLYVRWIDQEPDYFVISDQSDPAESLDLSNPFGPRFPETESASETLRSQWVLPDDGVSVLLLDGQGRVVHAAVGVQDRLAQALTQIKTLMVESDTEETTQ